MLKIQKNEFNVGRLQESSVFSYNIEIKHSCPTNKQHEYDIGCL